RKISLLALMIGFVSLTILIGCNKDPSDSTNNDPNDNKSIDGNTVYSLDDFNQTKTNEGEPIDGGEITVALGSETPFEGTLSPLFYSMAIDSTIMGWFTDSILDMDENFSYTQDGAATFELDDDNKVWTITIKDNVNWHDGEPVTAEDVEFSYYVLGDPEY